MAEEAPACLGRGAARGKPVPPDHASDAVHVGFVGAAVVARADRVGVRHGVGAHEIAAAQRHRVEAERGRGLVGQHLDHVGHFGPARAAIGLGRHGVGEGGAGGQARGRNVVGAGDERRALAERRERHAARADIAQILAPEREEAAVGRERQRRFHGEIAALIVGEHRLAARRTVFHRALQAPRRPQRQRVFDIRPVLRAEIAADIGRDDVERSGREAEHQFELALLAHGTAGRRIEREHARFVDVGQERARLDRHGSDAGNVLVEADDTVRSGKGARRRRLRRRRTSRPGDCPAPRPTRWARRARARPSPRARRAARPSARRPLRRRRAPGPRSRPRPSPPPRRHGAPCRRATARAGR